MFNLKNKKHMKKRFISKGLMALLVIIMSFLIQTVPVNAQSSRQERISISANKKPLEQVLEKLGKKYSLFIYIVHPIVLDVVWMIFYKWNVPKILGMIVIIPLVVVITLGIGGVYKKN